ncbi:hypothetical protein N665_2389s0003 [Sinapis alba]|nr:hypothetical protein N665_2389s0003 [Sinapis alba]
MNKNDVVRDVVAGLGFDSTYLVPPRGKSGGLALLWKKDVVVTKLFVSPRLIDVYVQYNGLNFFCLVHILWKKIQRIGSTRNGPWLLVGDFNEILNNSEKEGGPAREESSFTDFRNMFITCNLRDVRSVGDKFSWVGKRKTHVIKCCLDRVVANSEWLSLYPASEAEFLRLSGSDHRPVITTVSYMTNNICKPFRFDKRLFKIGQRLSDCRKAMSVCRSRNKLNTAKRIEELQTALDAALTSSGSLRNQIPRIKRELAQAYRDEETYWFLKSRNNWLCHGDRNTKFYHSSTKARYSRNIIHLIHDMNGFVYKGDTDIGRYAESFFKEVYRSGKTTVLPAIFKDFKPTVTPEINNEITRDTTNEETHLAICQIGADKTPGPDGLTARFYQEC